jgi:hypothetical protein
MQIISTSPRRCNISDILCCCSLRQAQLRFSQLGALKSFASQSLSRIRGAVIGQLVHGSCGKYEYSLLCDVADLLVHVLSAVPTSENEPHLVASLRSEQFLLGDAARITAFRFLMQYIAEPEAVTNPAGKQPDLVEFLQDVWQFHRIEDADALPASDVVVRFVQKYS